MRNLFLFTLLFSILGCAKKEAPKEELKPYIISEFKRKIDNLYKKPHNSEFPPEPPRMFDYGSNNFIIDIQGNIYYYQTTFAIGCGTGRENDTIPYFNNLKPEDIVQIPNNSIAEFVTLNLRKDARNFTHISSQLDTLNSKSSIELLKSVEKNSYRNDAFVIRQTTQEEDTVLHYKKENKYYSSEGIKWDKSRIKFRN